MSLDPYTPEEQISVGPSGKIYRGRGEATGLVVRIKALLGSQHIPCPVDRGVLQATLPYLLNMEHPHVAKLLDIDFDDHDFAVVSEFAPGLNIWEFLHQRPLMPAEAHLIASQMVMALVAGEEMGLHHGDVKPTNVFIESREDGSLCLQLQDWGLAACRSRQPEETLWFRAPERLTGGDATSTSDLFSVGAVMATLLLGHAPIEGHNAEQLKTAWAAFDPIVLRRKRADIEPALHDWIASLLHYEPTMRPASAAEAQAILEGWNTSHPVEEFEPQLTDEVEPLPEPVSEHPLLFEAPIEHNFIEPEDEHLHLAQPSRQPSADQHSGQPIQEPPARKFGTLFSLALNLGLVALFGIMVLFLSHYFQLEWPNQVRQWIAKKLDDRMQSSQPSGGTAKGILGRYLRVEIPGKATLSLAEIEIISGGINIAPTATATAKDHTSDAFPNRAIDGNTASDPSKNSVFESANKTDSPWIEIDLGSEKPIQSIRLWNLSDLPEQSKRLANYSVILLSKKRNVVWRIDGQPAPEMASVTFELSAP